MASPAESKQSLTHLSRSPPSQRYRPDSLTIGTRGRSVSTFQKILGGPMIGGSSRDILSRSPVPVVVVQPSNASKKHLKQRQNDPRRRSYHRLVGGSGTASPAPGSGVGSGGGSGGGSIYKEGGDEGSADLADGEEVGRISSED